MASRFDPLPIRRELRGYDRAKFRADLKASLSLTMVTLPMSAAIALMLGLPVSAGIVGAAAGAIFGPLFGTSRFVAPGPTNGSAALVLSALATVGPMAAGDRIALIAPLLMLSGIVLVAASFLNVASFAGFISRTVVTAYVTCAAERIITNQMPAVLGIGIPSEKQSFFSVVAEIWRQMGQASVATIMVALAVWLVIALVNRTHPRWPAPFVALILVSAATAVFCRFAEDRGLTPGIAFLDRLEFNGDTFSPSGRLGMDDFGRLFSPALALAFLCLIEATSIGRSLAAKSGERLNAGEVLFGTGVANIVSGAFGGSPVSGSLTRSAAAITAGAKTVMCGVFSGVCIILAAFFLGPLMVFVPKAALGAVVCHAACALFSPSAVKTCLRSTRADKAVYLLTFGVGLVAPLDIAIYFGVGLSVVLFLRKVAAPEIVEYAYNDRGHLAQVRDCEAGLKADPEVSIVHVEGNLFFGAAEIFTEQTRRVAGNPDLRVLVLKFRNAHNLDATGVMLLEELHRSLSERGSHLLICELRGEIIRVLRHSKFFGLIGREHLFLDTPANPPLSAARALRRAKKILGGRNARVSVYAKHSAPTEAKAEAAASGVVMSDRHGEKPTWFGEI